jgi:hypothetical protein
MPIGASCDFPSASWKLGRCKTDSNSIGPRNLQRVACSEEDSVDIVLRQVARRARRAALAFGHDSLVDCCEDRVTYASTFDARIRTSQDTTELQNKSDNCILGYFIAKKYISAPCIFIFRI